MGDKKIALVTGGSRGLGRDMVLNLAQIHIDVVFTYYTNKSAAEDVVKEAEKLGAKAFAIQLDTRKISSFDSFFRKLSGLLEKEKGNSRFDFLVNNAGTGVNATVEKTTEAEFDEMMNIHFKGVYFLTQKALPYIKDGGRIINISSGLVRYAFPGFSAYASMKGAIDVFTKYLAKELGPRKIAANAVAPGAIATDFGNGVNKNNQEKRELTTSMTALGRIGEVEDIGGVVAFLCSEKGRWINGQRIEVSGGMLV